MYSRVALLKRPRPLVPWSSWILKPQTKHEEEAQREECNEEHSARNTSQVSTLFLAVVLPLYTVCVDGGEAFSFWHDNIVGRPVTLHAPQWAHTIVELVKANMSIASVAALGGAPVRTHAQGVAQWVGPHSTHIQMG